MDESLAEKYRQGLMDHETMLSQAHDQAASRLSVDPTER